MITFLLYSLLKIRVAVAIYGLVVDLIKSVPIKLSYKAFESAMTKIFRQNIFQFFFIKNL